MTHLIIAFIAGALLTPIALLIGLIIMANSFEEFESERIERLRKERREAREKGEIKPLA